MKHFMTLAGIAVLLLVGGCATPPAARAPEPRIIVIRNSTGRDLQSVSLGTIPTRAGASRRIGSLAPVPSGASSTVVRPPAAPPLPTECELRWTNAMDETFSLKIGLKDVINHANGQPSEALVFEIRADGSVLVFLERNK